MRDHGTTLDFSPRLPAQLTRLCFRLTYRGRLLRVTVSGTEAHYELLDGAALDIGHHGEQVTLEGPGSPVARPIPPAPARPRPAQPPGREPPLGHARR
jgi:alpha,alpha-trehalose phosphorylase